MPHTRHRPDRMRGRRLLVDILAGVHTADPHKAADRVLGHVDDLDDAVDILAAVLPHWLTANTGNTRTTIVTPPKRKTNPPRLEGAAAAYQQILASQETVADGTRKFMRDLTVDEIRYAAEKRHGMAQSYTQTAQRFERLADEMTAAGVETVGDLDGDTLVEVMTR